jgi:hypothetical protein
MCASPPLRGDAGRGPIIRGVLILIATLRGPAPIWTYH